MKTLSEDKKETGLHFCKNYQNLVRYIPELCGKCRFNGRSIKADDENCP
jgi:hypothetical protein